MYLFFDTSHPAVTRIVFDTEVRFVSSLFKAQFHQAEQFLIALEKLRAQYDFLLRDVKGIVVVQGPGPFTALRVGIIAANTLGYALGCPTIGIPSQEWRNVKEFVDVARVRIQYAQTGRIIEPQYGKPPSVHKKAQIIL